MLGNSSQRFSTASWFKSCLLAHTWTRTRFMARWFSSIAMTVPVRSHSALSNESTTFLLRSSTLEYPFLYSDCFLSLNCLLLFCFEFPVSPRDPFLHGRFIWFLNSNLNIQRLSRTCLRKLFLGWCLLRAPFGTFGFSASLAWIISDSICSTPGTTSPFRPKSMNVDRKLIREYLKCLQGNSAVMIPIKFKHHGV